MLTIDRLLLIFDFVMLIAGVAYYFRRQSRGSSFGSILGTLPEENDYVVIDKYGQASCPSCGAKWYISYGLEKFVTPGEEVRSWLVFPRGICHSCYGKRSSKVSDPQVKIALAAYFICLPIRVFSITIFPLSVEVGLLWLALFSVGLGPTLLLEHRTARANRDIKSVDKTRDLIIT